MNSVLEQQLAWVRAVMAHLGDISANELAKRAGFNPSTLQRPMNAPDWKNALSGRTLAAIGKVANLKPMEYPTRPAGFGEAEAVPFVYDERSDTIEANVDRAVRELTRGRNGRDPWQIRSHALELSGILPGDIVIVDLNMQPKPKDIVCAQLYEWSHMKAETVFRVYDPPYLMTNSMRFGVQKPLLVDDNRVAIKGVVDVVLRRRQLAA
jgi:hypothetical protein